MYVYGPASVDSHRIYSAIFQASASFVYEKPLWSPLLHFFFIFCGDYVMCRSQDQVLIRVEKVVTLQLLQHIDWHRRVCSDLSSSDLLSASRTQF